MTKSLIFLGFCFAAASTAAGAGCSSSSSNGAQSGDAGIDPKGDSATAIQSDGAAFAIALPQAVSGAMWANPDVYKEIPLHIDLQGAASAEITVKLEGKSTPATRDANGRYAATLSLDGITDGDHEVAVDAKSDSGALTSTKATLVIGHAGAPLTTFASDGAASTPRFHRAAGESDLWLTWADRSSGKGAAYLRRIDGGGKFKGDRTVLLPVGDEILYARAAFGKSSIGVLFQVRGAPYKNRFMIVDRLGKEMKPAIDLEQGSEGGRPSGDVAFDGTGYVFTWRSSTGGEKSELRWMRVDESSKAAVGPIVLAKSDAADVEGGFDDITPHTIAANAAVSVAAYARKRYDSALATAVPKCRTTIVKPDGTVVASEFCGREDSMIWDEEARIFSIGGAFVAGWAARDLNDEADVPPVWFYGATASPDGHLDPQRGGGKTMLKGVNTRGEMFLTEHADKSYTLAWVDHRSYTPDPLVGHMQLYAASVDSLAAQKEILFPHARFVANSSDLVGTPAGSNALLVWLDERNGGSVINPKPELRFETVWR